MLYRPTRMPRRGNVIGYAVFGAVAICMFTSLAIDLGMVMVAKTQAQNAADAAAMAGARTLNGDTDGNATAATTNAQNTATSNSILTSSILPADVTLIQHGAYHYDTTAQTFSCQFPPVSPDNYCVTQVTIKKSNATMFARIFNMSAFNVSATSIAAHRPRDVAIILDYSGSMNNESDLWNNETYLGSVNNSPNNNDTVVPTFGAYSSTNATLINTSTDARVGMCNLTQTVQSIPPMVNDFYQNARSASGIAAFYSVPYTQLYLPPAGDTYMAKNGTSTTPPTYATNVQDITGATSAQITAKTDALMPAYTSFSGYTRGPGYWGQTFFIWPPYPEDPTSMSSPPKDWRHRFFLNPGGSYPTFGGALNDNTKLWDSGGNWKLPTDSNGNNYIINYSAILSWISTNCVQASVNDGKPFPPTLRAGGILYYNSIPTDVPQSAYTWSSGNTGITDPTQRFWKEYIDFVIGVWQDPFGNAQTPGHPACSYGPDFTWGTVQVSAPVTGYATAPTTRIHPQDNPKRPRHRFWFGPMTMIQYMSDTGHLPGTSHDISMVAAKLGTQSALQDIQQNHPNDLVSMILFSRPHYQNEPTEAGAFSQAQFGLGRTYSAMVNALWFSPTAPSTADIRPWDANDVNTPRAHGDYTGNTATGYGFRLAYNQFSSSSYLRTNGLGGYGRKGAARLVILETDGMANVASSTGFTGGGAYNSYYNVASTDTVTVDGSTSPGQDAINVATRLAALTTDTTNGPGYGTPNKAVTIHCLGFGAVFEPTAQGSEQANALTFLQQISAIGGTSFPSSVSNTSDPYYYKLCVGTLSQRQSKLQTAFTLILDSGAAIVMVK